MTPHRMSEATWHNSSYSNDSGGNCVEVANLTPKRDSIALRDSKNPQGPALLLPPSAFTAFVSHVRQMRRP